MAEDIIVIPKEDIPSQSFSLMVRMPKYGDLREARKSYPAQDMAEAEKLPYSVEELLFAKSIIGIDDKPFKYEPRDIIDRLADWEIADRQYLTLAFISGVFLGPEEAKAARKKGNDLQMQGLATNYTILRNELPSQTVSFTFNKPNSSVQFAVERKFQSPYVNGCSLEEMLFAASLESIDGVDVAPAKDIISVLDSQEIIDVQYLAVALVNLVSIDDSGSKAAKEMGKSKFRNFGSIKPASKVKTTKQQQAEAQAL